MDKLKFFYISHLFMLLIIIIISYYKFRIWWFIIPFGIFTITFSIWGEWLWKSQIHGDTKK